MPLEPGDVFAGYRILRRVGVGGMGTVYLAEHPRLPRRDALKVLAADLAEDPQFRARFQREAALAARLEHPHIVSVYDCGIEGDRLWIAMRYVDGIDAAELVGRSPGGIPIERAVGIIDGAARGLDAAHRRHLLHRDVKPANILVGTRDDGSDDVRVADFGIARTLDEAGGATSTGATPATLAYAAPEQFDNGPLDHRVDVYALGCTLAHLLTGAPPFAGRSTAATIHAHLFEPPPRVSLLRPGLPPAMDDVIARAMAKDPNRRFGSCGELAAAAAAALRHPAGNGVPANPAAPPGPHPGPWLPSG
ncbi:serine/threonine-protein kinase, partial [Millisia brevis]|uniref:serine/threonine-protein kinase n=1 Tax=Millisia brevis TaxID=264148 RepID=UPI001FDF2579